MSEEASKTPGPSKLRPISGLLSLSSSNNKKSLIKFLPRINRKQILDIELDSGFIRPRDLTRFFSNVFQYLLYDNEIIPFPFQYFERALENRMDERSQQRANGAVDDENCEDNDDDDDEHDYDEDADYFQQSIQVFSNPLKPQVQKMYCELYECFQCFDTLFDQSLPLNTVKSIALGIGASIRFLKDIYILDISGLNIFDQATNSGNNRAQQTIVSLSTIVQGFFRKLLEASTSGEMKPNNTQKRKQNSVFILAQLTPTHAEIVENFYLSSLSSSSLSSRFKTKKQDFVPETLEKIGSNGTRTTVFKLHHDELHHRLPVEDFVIFCDDDLVENGTVPADHEVTGDEHPHSGKDMNETEEIVEALTEEDEQALAKALNSSNRSESLSSLASSVSTSSEKSDNFEGFTEDRVWIELIPHVNCVAKL